MRNWRACWRVTILPSSHQGWVTTHTRNGPIHRQLHTIVWESYTIEDQISRRQDISLLARFGIPTEYATPTRGRTCEWVWVCDDTWTLSLLDHHGLQHHPAGHEWDWDETHWDHQAGEQHQRTSRHVHGHGHAGGEPGRSLYTLTGQHTTMKTTHIPIRKPTTMKSLSFCFLLLRSPSPSLSLFSGGDDRSYRVQRGALSGLCREGRVWHQEGSKVPE